MRLMHGLIEEAALSSGERVYEPFNIYPIPAGNTGTQMFGWFNKEINSLDDIKGLKMRIPGIGGEVLERAGGIPVTLPGGNYLPLFKLASLMQQNGLAHTMI